MGDFWRFARCASFIGLFFVVLVLIFNNLNALSDAESGWCILGEHNFSRVWHVDTGYVSAIDCTLDITEAQVMAGGWFVDTEVIDLEDGRIVGGEWALNGTWQPPLKMAEAIGGRAIETVAFLAQFFALMAFAGLAIREFMSRDGGQER